MEHLNESAIIFCLIDKSDRHKYDNNAISVKLAINDVLIKINFSVLKSLLAVQQAVKYSVSWFFLNMERESRNLSENECVAIVTLAEEDISYRQIARRFGIHHTTVSRVVQRFRETNGYSRRPGQGRHRSTTAVEDRFLRLRAVRERFTTARSLQQQLARVHGVQVSIETVRTRLAEVNLHPRVPARCPALSPDHRRSRLDFAREHADWDADMWERVLFTDESRFFLHSNDRRARVYRRPHERYYQCNISETHLFGGGSIMVWGGISLTGRTDLHVFNRGSVTADRYITDILEPYVVPFAPYIGENFLLMHDNARPHTAAIVQDYLQEVDIETMVWPARSPDLNPIEHVWDMLGRRLRATQPPPPSLEEVGQRLYEIWNDLDQELIRTLILSMESRCREVIRQRGGNTHY